MPLVSITTNSTSSGTLVHVWSQTAWPIILRSPPHNILPHMQSLHRLFAWSSSRFWVSVLISLSLSASTPLCPLPSWCYPDTWLWIKSLCSDSQIHTCSLDPLPWALLYVHQVSPHVFLGVNSRASLPELLSVGLSQRCWGHPVSGQVLQSPRWPVSCVHTWLPLQDILSTLPSAAPSSPSSLFLFLHFLGGLLHEPSTECPIFIFVSFFPCPVYQYFCSQKENIV